MRRLAIDLGAASNSYMKALQGQWITPLLDFNCNSDIHSCKGTGIRMYAHSRFKNYIHKNLLPSKFRYLCIFRYYSDFTTFERVLALKITQYVTFLNGKIISFIR